MNTHAPEMLERHYTAMKTTLTGGDDVSVFERQAARMKWQQQQHESFSNGNDDQFPGLIENKPDPGVQNGWPDFSDGCQDQLPPALMSDQKVKKRKTHEDHKVVSNEDGIKDKKIKGCSAEENSVSVKKKSKVTDAKKQDYIHVRARRGQATDSHSLAERVRREKISERMKYLQELVPGCNKITGKAGMLDEIINYVQSLQKQVEFLSMRLATLHPRFDLDTNNRIMKEMFEVSAVGYSPEMANCSTYFHINSLLEMENNPLDMMLRRSINGGPLSVPETFIVSCFNQMQPSVIWDGNQQESLTIPYQLQKYTDSGEGSNLKVEM